MNNYEQRVLAWVERDPDVFIGTMIVYGNTFMPRVKAILMNSPLSSEFVSAWRVSMLAASYERRRILMAIGHYTEQTSGSDTVNLREFYALYKDTNLLEGIPEWFLLALAQSADLKIALNLMPYREYLKTIHWRDMRLQALRQAGYRCQLCNAEQGLQVHHRTYERRGFEDPLDLTVLCDMCHEKFHTMMGDES